MGVFSWPGRNVVGCPEMDNNHEPALKMLDRLHEAMIQGRGEKVVLAILDELNEFYPVYFAREEALLASTAYPDLEEHRRKHGSLLRALADLRRKAGIGHLAITYDTMQTMRRWVEEHVNVDDRHAAMHVMEHRSSIPPA
ncbi:MAG: bacteriohemerythrin [Bryobacteraceae bacterium]